jgi:hypothetical protein
LPQQDAWAGSDPVQPRSLRLTRWRAAFYQSRPLAVLTHIVALTAGANLLGALAVIPPILLMLILTVGDGAPNPVRGRGFLVAWAMALVLGDGALRWGQPRGGRIRRWISTVQGGCFVFIPCWLLGVALLALTAWSVFFHDK